jgi:hypothetical protein
VKVRVHELAKELGISSKELLTKVSELGEFVKSASSNLEAPVVQRVRECFPIKPKASGTRPAYIAYPDDPAPSAATHTPRPPRPAGRSPRVTNNPFGVAGSGAARAVRPLPLPSKRPRKPRREFYRGDPPTGLTARILRECIVPNRNWQGMQPPKGFFADEVKAAKLLTAEWGPTLFDGLTPDLIIEWLGGENAITPEQAVTFHQAGVTPEDLEGPLRYVGRPSLRLRLEVGNITVEQAIAEVKSSRS